MPLTVKVRYKQELWLVLSLLISLSSASTRCDKTPAGYMTPRSLGDNGFRISLNGNPTLYRPGTTYEIELFGLETEDGDDDPSRKNFINFMLVAESDRLSTELPQLGTFQLMPGDAMTKFSHRCSHAVDATSAINKEGISVLWTAPGAGSGCINLRAAVVERPEVWYMDEGSLTYVICEDQSPLAPTVVLPCHACGEAKYEVIFEGLWSRHTHPKDFPVDEWQTQFSHVVGASHDINYNLWKYGEVATEPLVSLAEEGVTQHLEMQMKKSSQNIRSVIKARGLHQRSNVVGRTFAVFRTDKHKHLLSLVSKMIPSPDWMVGISMEDLCMANRSWVDSRVIDLWPLDAGSKSGLSYQDVGVETRPREVIHRITSCSPADDRSPFYDPSCSPVKPVARVHILKQREYKKVCEDGMDGVTDNWRIPGNAVDPGLDTSIYNGRGIGPSDPIPGEEVESSYGEYNQLDPSYTEAPTYGNPQDHCALTEWSEWSGCSSTCGTGSHHRTRTYLDETRAQRRQCRMELIEKKRCRQLPECERRNYIPEFNAFGNGDDMSGYSSPYWSRGISAGNLRRPPVTEPEPDPDPYSVNSYSYGGEVSPEVPPDSYLAGYAKQKGFPPNNNPLGSSRYNPYRAAGYYGYTYGGSLPAQQAQDSASEIYQGDEMSPNCDVTTWGEWSECSSSCGSGARTRNRGYVDRDATACSEDLTESTVCNNDCSQGPFSPQPTASPQVQKKKRFRGKRRRKTFRKVDKQCSVAEWSNWTPCSVSCGSGYKIRTRLYLIPFVLDRVCEGLRLHEKRSCVIRDCNYYMDDSDDDVRSDFYNYDYDQEDEPEERDSAGDLGPSVTIYEMQEPKQSFCLLDPNPGSCRGKITRWYYNATEGMCLTFTYTFCGGSDNNFESEQDCLDACHPDTRVSSIGQLQALAQTRPSYLDNAAVDCQVTDWSDWSHCSVTCGKGWVTRTRSVVTEPSNGGRRCPRKLEKRKKCKMQSCSTPPDSWYQGNWRMLQQQREMDILA